LDFVVPLYRSAMARNDRTVRLATDATYFHRLVSALGPNEAGLSDDEVASIEARYGFVFTPDLRALLKYCVLVAGEFPKWRGDPAELEKSLRRPSEELRFEVEHNAFWREAWGPRPWSRETAVELVAGLLRQAPALVPVYGRCYMPSPPVEAGNPVFRLDAGSLSYAGFDLVAYFKHEFHVPFVESRVTEPRRIDFWSDLVR
jgi:hypothetical protein